jgi:hypothetical protein
MLLFYWMHVAFLVVLSIKFHFSIFQFLSSSLKNGIFDSSFFFYMFFWASSNVLSRFFHHLDFICTWFSYNQRKSLVFLLDNVNVLMHVGVPLEVLVLPILLLVCQYIHSNLSHTSSGWFFKVQLILSDLPSSSQTFVKLTEINSSCVTGSKKWMCRTEQRAKG